MKFVEFHPGQLITAGPYQVNEAEILSFAHKWDLRNYRIRLLP